MRAKRLAVVIAAAALVAAGCGNPSANSAAAQAQNVAAAAQAGGSSSGQAGSVGPRGAALNSANFATGRIKAIDGGTIQVSTATEVLTLKTTGDTKIQKTTSGSPSDIQAGVNITVRGTRGSDGTLTAQMVQIGDPMGSGMPPAFGAGAANGQAPAGQGPAGQSAAGQGAPAQGAGPAGAMPTPGAGGPAGGRGQFNANNFASGQVKQVDGNTIQITTASDVVTVKVSDQTLIRKTVAAGLSDLAVGDRITAQGTRGSGNTFTAQAIQVGDSGPGGGQPPATPAASN